VLVVKDVLGHIEQVNLSLVFLGQRVDVRQSLRGVIREVGWPKDFFEFLHFTLLFTYQPHMAARHAQCIKIRNPNIEIRNKSEFSNFQNVLDIRILVIYILFRISCFEFILFFT
jgi:hypothetical protein